MLAVHAVFAVLSILAVLADLCYDAHSLYLFTCKAHFVFIICLETREFDPYVRVML